MNIQEFSKKIFELEGKYDIYNEKIGEYYIWPFLRIQLYLYFKKIHASSIQVKKTSFLNKFGFVVRSVRAFIDFLTGKAHDKIALTNSSFRSNVNNIYYDRVVDPFQITSGNRDLWIYEFSANFRFNRPAHNEGKIVPIQLLFLVLVKLNLKAKSLILSQDVQYFLQDIGNFYPRLQKYLDKDDIIDAICKHVVFIKSWKAILKRNQVKEVYLNCYYDSKGLSLAAACRDLHIKVFDLQHGIQGDYHIAYSGWHKFSAIVLKSTLPNFLVWNDQAFQNLMRQGLVTKNIGYGWVKLWKENWFSYKSSLPDNIILYTLQPLDDPFPEILMNFFKKFNYDYTIFVRVHPSQIQNLDYYSNELFRLSSNFQYNMTDASDLPLPYILAHTKLHITKWSTVALEAALFNIPTWFLSNNGLKFFQDTIAPEYLITDVEKCQKLLKKR